MPKNKSWFRMSKKEDLAEIEIFDEIDPFWGIGVKEFKASFDEIKDARAIKLWLNSGGGDIFEGMAIYHVLETVREKLTVEVIGLAASMASIIALSGSKLIMANGSYYMIHDPRVSMGGTAEDLRRIAGLLDKMKLDALGIYRNKTGLDDDAILKMMADETWMTAEEAIDNGFADENEDYGEIAACADPALIKKYGFRHVPQIVASVGEKEKITNPRDFEGALRDLGFSKKEAVAIVADGWKAMGRSDSEPVNRSDSDKPCITPAMLIAEMDLSFR